MMLIKLIYFFRRYFFSTAVLRAAVQRFFKVALGFVCLLVLAGCHQSITGVLNPKGIVAFQERKLLFDSLALMLIVVIPVIIMSIAFVIRYRASHRTADYKPNWHHSSLLESIWWGIPCAIIVVLGIMTWVMTHRLDPYHPIKSRPVDLQIKVVALPWKWLFIYPNNTATVNYLQLPVNRQVEFLLTSDNVPMSAFFVPQLGGQIYTMAGMRTRLHLLATQTGTYRGLNSQYNGDGFSDMHFVVKVVSPQAMKNWLAQLKRSPQRLDSARYKKLTTPSVADPVRYYASVKPGLFKRIIESYNTKEEVNS